MSGFDRVLLWTQVKIALIGTCLVLGASAIVHAVVFPPPPDPPAFSPPPGRLTPLPLLPVR
ncbi:hypothetical protein ACFW91_06840 [Streptomyces asoensis]|uniref:hypothetical protein n=1 Tax=Streptomyces asoensis TaxID=249586 RepID=UPI00368388B5